ncbi:MAG: helix-turn-helix transcriptional regulator [Pseudonocardiales bacterium]|nr:helix-turn-helix transcriptional regulator [Pseudonocardiales bacterium]
MPTESRPTLRAQWLGQSLRELRDANGMTLARAADFLQRNASTVSRFESGEYPIRRPDLMALLDLYGVSDRHKRDGLLRLSEEVWQKGWWDGYEPDVERQFVDFVWLESRATEIRSFDPSMITGLLQTRDYATAVVTAAEWEAEPAQIARWVQLRMDRQAVLHREAPPRLQVIIDESVLRREIGGPDVMSGQLAHLLAIAKLPHVDLRVLPASIGAHASLSGGFCVFTIAEPDLEVGYAETVGGSVYVEPPASERFVRVYTRLLNGVLGPAESAKLICAIGEDCYDPAGPGPWPGRSG